MSLLSRACRPLPTCPCRPGPSTRRSFTAVRVVPLPLRPAAAPSPPPAGSSSSFAAGRPTDLRRLYASAKPEFGLRFRRAAFPPVERARPDRSAPPSSGRPAGVGPGRSTDPHPPPTPSTTHAWNPPLPARQPAVPHAPRSPPPHMHRPGKHADQDRRPADGLPRSNASSWSTAARAGRPPSPWSSTAPSSTPTSTKSRAYPHRNRTNRPAPPDPAPASAPASAEQGGGGPTRVLIRSLPADTELESLKEICDELSATAFDPLRPRTPSPSGPAPRAINVRATFASPAQAAKAFKELAAVVDADGKALDVVLGGLRPGLRAVRKGQGGEVKAPVGAGGGRGARAGAKIGTLSAKLVLTMLAPETTNDELHALCDPLGALAANFVRSGGTDRKTALVSFVNPTTAADALAALRAQTPTDPAAAAAEPGRGGLTSASAVRFVVASGSRQALAPRPVLVLRNLHGGLSHAAVVDALGTHAKGRPFRLDWPTHADGAPDGGGARGKPTPFAFAHFDTPADARAVLASIGKRHLLVGQPVQAVVVDLRLNRAASAAAGPGREPLFHPRPQSRKAKAASAKPSTSALHVVKLPPGLPTATLEAVVAAALGPDAAFEVRRRSLPLSTAPAGPDGGGGLLPFAFIQLASAADATRVKRALEGSPDVAGVEVCFVARRDPKPHCPAHAAHP